MNPNPEKLVGAMEAGAVISTILNFADSLVTFFKKEKTSLSRQGSRGRVEFSTIIEDGLMSYEGLPDVLNAAQIMSIGFYFTAASALNTVGNITVGERLDQLNPNRNADSSSLRRYIGETVVTEHATMNMESYKMGLPLKAPKATMENVIDSRSLDKLNDSMNLATGRIVNLTIQSKGESVTVPVTIMLRIHPLDRGNVQMLLGTGSVKTSISERWHRYRAGRITFWNDFILNQDLMRERRRLLANDKSGVVKGILERNAKNRKASFYARNQGLAEASNILVFSRESADRLYAENGVNINKDKDRQDIYDRSSTMLLIMVDPNRDEITFFTNGMSDKTTVSLRVLQYGNKRDSLDPMAVINSYIKGGSPSF